MRSSMVRCAMGIEGRFPLLVSRFPKKRSEGGTPALQMSAKPLCGRQHCRRLLYVEALDDVADFDVIEVGNADTAFHTVAHFAGIIFETLERPDLAGEYHRA